MKFNRNDILQAYMLFVTILNHVSLDFLQPRGFSPGEREKQVANTHKKIWKILKGDFPRVCEITNKPMSENAQRIFANLIKNFKITGENTAQYIADMLLKDNKNGFLFSEFWWDNYKT